MAYLSDDQVKTKTPGNGKPAPGPAQSPQQAQMIFIGTLLFIVLSVTAEYVLGEYAGLNIGEDFGMILGGTLAFGIAAGFVAGAVHHWTHHSRRP